MQKITDKNFEIIISIMVFLRTILESFFSNIFLGPVFINQSFFYYINSFLLIFIILKNTTNIKEYDIKRYFILFFIIPLITIFLIPFTKNIALNYLYFNNILDFFKSYFSLLQLSSIHVLIKIEALIIIPGIFLLLFFKEKIKWYKSLLISWLIYSQFIFTGILHYTSNITKGSPHDILNISLFLFLLVLINDLKNIKKHFISVLFLYLTGFLLFGYNSLIFYFHYISFLYFFIECVFNIKIKKFNMLYLIGLFLFLTLSLKISYFISIFMIFNFLLSLIKKNNIKYLSLTYIIIFFIVLKFIDLNFYKFHL